MLTKSLTLTEQVARQIADDIAHGVYPVGGKLPSGRILAEQYGVSAAVIREVTERLRAQGLVQSRQGSGSVVLARTGAQGFQVPCLLYTSASRAPGLAAGRSPASSCRAWGR